ncbi:MAG TPA: hypothetical protein VEI97_18020 [bacterium]|nr:hypothetical protein [bacterium]
MRWIAICACVALIAGCQSGGRTPLLPELEPAQPDNPFATPEREGQAVLGGKVTLNGAVETAPEGVQAPYRAQVPAQPGDLALLRVKATAAPPSNTSLRAQFAESGVPLGHVQVSASGALQHLPFYLESGGTFDLALYNSLTSSSALYDGLARWQYTVYTRPADDPDEPNDDGRPDTTSDRAQARTWLREGRVLFNSLYQRVEGVTEDREDWYRLELQGGTPYGFQFANSNGQWGTWRYHLRVVSDQGVLQASLQTGGTGSTLYFTPTGSGRRVFYLQVTGVPESRRGNSVYFGEYSLGLSPGPRLEGVALSDDESGQPCSFTVANIGGPVTTWRWRFDRGASPETSAAEAPAVTLGEAGTYAGSVTAWGPGGSHTLPFTFTVIPPLKEVGLHVQVVKYNEDTWPVLWGNLAGWTEGAMQDWVVAYMNPAFRSAGFKFKRELVTLVPVVTPALYNLDNSSEATQLQALCVQGDPTKLNITMVNNNNYSGTYGQMQDHSTECNYDNNLRGCWAISVRSSWTDLRSTMCHEIGHVVYLPHICTGGCSDPAKYDNLMSYQRNGSIRLWDSIARESGTNCYMSQLVQMNQNQVAKDWVTQYLP